MKNRISKIIIMSFIAFSCADKGGFYSEDDYKNVEKMDVHSHVWTDKNFLVDYARKNNFKLLSVMVDHGKSDELTKQLEYSIFQLKKNPDVFSFATAFPMEGWDEPDWVSKTIDYINATIDSGAVAVKVWKNIGMEFRDKDSNMVMIDNPKFDPIFKMLSDKKIPLMGHLGEPRNCWLPLEEMTTNDDRNYFKNNPQYHMYLHKEFPSYEDQVNARDRMLEKNPDLVFIGAHLGSLEWSVDEIAKRLDKFPNMYVDMAARMGHLHIQTYKDREKVRNFFIKYQDRLLYGTDRMDLGKEDDIKDSQQSFYDTWQDDWRYFVTDLMLKDQMIDQEFQGLKLPKEVVDKIYIKNAKRILNVFN